MYSACFSFSSPNILSPKTSEKPMMAFSGIRDQCHILARNSDLWRLAASISPLLYSISRNSHAFCIAKAHCVAKVWRRFTISGEKLPASFRQTVKAPRRSCSRSSGTARTDRYPRSASMGRNRAPVYSRSSRVSGTWTGARIIAARPVAPSPKRIGASRSASTRASSIW